MPKRVATRIWLYGLRSKNIGLISYEAPDQKAVFDRIHHLKKETGMLQEVHEAYQLYQIASSLQRIPGDMAEVGVYTGGTACLLREADTKKTLHLFDTFTGIPEVSEEDTAYFYKGQFATSLQAVKNRLNAYENILFHPGFFPETASIVKENTFSLVHLDADTYRSTQACLSFFYSRMSEGGMIVGHDYTTSAGVHQAFSEFFSDKKETVLTLLGTQCMVVKLGF